MRQIARRLSMLLLATAAGGGASGGCGNAAPAASAATALATTASNSAVTAVRVVQAAAVAVTNVPELVNNLVDQLVSSKHPDWGKPNQIIVTDQAYIFLFPTSAADQKRNNGVPHFVIIQRTDQPDPSQRL
jgi:hypothetical protein